MKPDELKRLSAIMNKHLEKWGFYYFFSFLAGTFGSGMILVTILAPEGSGTATTSDLIISGVIATTGFVLAAINQSVAWLRSFSDRKHAKKLRRMREVAELESELGLDSDRQELVH